MRFSYYNRYINKKTRLRYDVTPIFQDPNVFSNLINDLIRPFKKKRFNKIAGIDALGFIVGGALSNKLKKGFVTIRKQGKLPGFSKNIVKTSFIDYSGNKKTFEMNKSSIKKGDRILLVDEWIETGSQIKAAIRLIEKQGGIIIGISAISAEKHSGTDILFEKYNCRPIRIQKTKRK